MKFKKVNINSIAINKFLNSIGDKVGDQFWRQTAGRIWPLSSNNPTSLVMSSVHNNIAISIWDQYNDENKKT